MAAKEYPRIKTVGPLSILMRKMIIRTIRMIARRNMLPRLVTASVEAMETGGSIETLLPWRHSYL
jgi:hypothetical protein